MHHSSEYRRSDQASRIHAGDRKEDLIRARGVIDWAKLEQWRKRKSGTCFHACIGNHWPALEPIGTHWRTGVYLFGIIVVDFSLTFIGVL